MATPEALVVAAAGIASVDGEADGLTRDGLAGVGTGERGRERGAPAGPAGDAGDAQGSRGQRDGQRRGTAGAAAGAGIDGGDGQAGGSGGQGGGDGDGERGGADERGRQGVAADADDRGGDEAGAGEGEGEGRPARRHRRGREGGEWLAAGLVAVTVRVAGALAKPLLVTVIASGPAAVTSEAGTVAVSVVALTYWVASAVPPALTVEALTKPVPVRVRVKVARPPPPATG